MKFREHLGNKILFFDGGMGSLLQARGLQTGEIPEHWNIQHPDRIKQVHKEYLAAGCNVISANTFGANYFKCRDSAYSVEQLVKAGVQIVKDAISETQQEMRERLG